MIVTVTLNPSVDVPLALDEVALGQTNRCVSSGVEPGGKALNASRVIHRLGGETIAYGFAGGLTGALLRRRLDDEGVRHEFDEVGGMTRMDVMVYERLRDRRTRLLAAGPGLTSHDLNRLRERLAKIPPGALVVIGGSVPPGVDVDVYAALTGMLQRRGSHCIVDASGAALAAVLAAHPMLVKPNEEEAAEILERSVTNDEEALAAARELQARGARSVVISQGERGAVGVDDSGAWKVSVPAVDVLSTIGSGDSMVGGMALALENGATFEEALGLGAAAGTATAMAPGRNLCSAGDVASIAQRVAVEPMGVAARSA